MTNELAMLLSGGGLAQLRDAAIPSYIYHWHNTIHQAIDDIRALGNPGNGIGISGTRLHCYTLYKTTHSCIYTQQNTLPGTYRITN